MQGAPYWREPSLERPFLCSHSGLALLPTSSRTAEGSGGTAGVRSTVSKGSGSFGSWAVGQFRQYPREKQHRSEGGVTSVPAEISAMRFWLCTPGGGGGVRLGKAKQLW